ncbi:GNAT family N-acetyltransferase [Chamaesiphon minutus]|uniref:Acetyltransferase, ribosomal protein N-acetylase n=1 Tax=Chamaesiphon minutus (strain ATCC 27169 / PCC 6605) TaxID=1173020 RepID=K9UE58_CHAP6|nr:GNAT family N-acetyltransferase [Chamaesiphon minutus]AFY92711.1 acetyltransferase, ribosomal protein N-acetylase [Chamaesiphon minutus PCC 6605]
MLINQDFSSISFPCLETKRLWLRQATQEDTEAVFAMFSDPKVTQFHDLDTFTHLDEAIGVIERWISGFESGHRIRWGIARKQDNCLIGSCGFRWDTEANAAVIGYELASQFWRQGIMSEALHAILQYEFERTGAQFAIAEIMLENIASRRLLEKLGFRSQRVLKKHGFWKGERHDLEQFMLTRAKFTAG